mmetsp:Transcript_35368/g.92849  ORF Transcript_35368/g.92849 Transcript_35368/m.92849 type:complete len:312 (-) Transcript_35368:250-1185(-)
MPLALVAIGLCLAHTRPSVSVASLDELQGATAELIGRDRARLPLAKLLAGQPLNPVLQPGQTPVDSLRSCSICYCFLSFGSHRHGGRARRVCTRPSILSAPAIAATRLDILAGTASQSPPGQRTSIRATSRLRGIDDVEDSAGDWLGACARSIKCGWARTAANTRVRVRRFAAAVSRRAAMREIVQMRWKAHIQRGEVGRVRQGGRVGQSHTTRQDALDDILFGSCIRHEMTGRRIRRKDCEQVERWLEKQHVCVQAVKTALAALDASRLEEEALAMRRLHYRQRGLQEENIDVRMQYHRILRERPSQKLE